MIEQLLKRIVPLLGKTDSSPEFKQLLKLVGEAPSLFEVEGYKFYEYHKLGFGLIYDGAKFFSVLFMYDTDRTRTGEFERYQGDLPAGITWTDTCSEAELKLGLAPESATWLAESYWQSYSCAPYKYTLIFNNEQTGLGSLGMKLLE